MSECFQPGIVSVVLHLHVVEAVLHVLGLNVHIPSTVQPLTLCPDEQQFHQYSLKYLILQTKLLVNYESILSESVLFVCFSCCWNSAV